MHVCFLCRDFLRQSGGLESYVHQMARFLPPEGHFVHIIAEECARPAVEKLPEGGVFVHMIKLTAGSFKGSWRVDRIFPLSNLIYSQKVQEMIRGICAEYPIDIIEAPDYGGEGFRYSLKRIRPVPLAVRLHGVIETIANDKSQAGGLAKRVRNWFLRYVERTPFCRADLVTSVSADYALRTEKAWNFIPAKRRVIPNGVDLGFFYPLPGQKRLRTVLFAGRIERKKGVGVLADAINLLGPAVGDVEFVFAGRDTKFDKTGRTWKEEIEQRLAGKAKVKFVGQLSKEELRSYYQNSLMAVFPSLYEPFGLVAIEAMACGCAVIASACGGFREIIEHEKNGLLVPAGEPHALAKAVKRLLEDNDLRQRMGDLGIKKVKECFDIRDIARKTVIAYRDYLN